MKDDDIKQPNIAIAAALITGQVSKANQQSIELMRQRNRAANKQQYGCDCPLAKCDQHCPTYLINCSEDDRWLWLAQTRPPDRREVEVMPPGEPSFKGGSKSGKKRKKKPPKSWFVNPFLD